VRVRERERACLGGSVRGEKKGREGLSDKKGGFGDSKRWEMEEVAIRAGEEKVL
jgi:hypothetical protein